MPDPAKMRPTAVLLAGLVLPCAAWAQGGNPAGPEFRVNTYTTGIQARSSARVDALGNFVVVWMSGAGQDGAAYGVFGQRYAGTGAPSGPEFRVNTYTPGPQGYPTVAGDPAGNFVVLWTSNGQDGSGDGVFGQRFAGTGAPVGPEFRVNTYTTGGQHTAAAVSDTAGNFVVVWTSAGQDGAGDGVFGQRFASTGAPLGGEFRVNSYTTLSQHYPAVAGDTAGNFVVVWGSAEDGSAYGIFGQRYASTGAPLGPEFRVSTYTTGNQVFSSVASDGAGGFIVAWLSENQDGSGRGIYAQRFAGSGAAAGPEFRVNTYTTGIQEFASVAADASGDFVVAWQSDQQDGSGHGVFAQRFAASGSPLGPEFRVTTYTTGSQDDAWAAAAPGGDFVVVWTSAGQDGSSYGVFGQRFAPILPVELMRFDVE